MELIIFTMIYIIDIENFDAKLLRIDKKSYKDIDIFNIGYVAKKKIGDCININSVNPLYLGITHDNGYIEEKDSNEYLVFNSTYEIKELLKKYSDVFNGIIMSKIRELDDNWFEYARDYAKIKFSSDDDLPLDKPLKFSLRTITIRCVFKENNKLYPQLFLDDTLYQLQK